MLTSRVHPLKIAKECYCKREDELGCIISGSKARKYASLIPAIQAMGHKEVGLVGSYHSNNILGLSSRLIECGITPILFLLEPSAGPHVGNALFIDLFVPKKHIHLIPRDKWPQVMDEARKKVAYVVPEGADCAESVPGLMTLAEDIVRNEEELGFEFRSILVDAGTGLTASTLIAYFSALGKKCTIHVCQMAPTSEPFEAMLTKVEPLINKPIKERTPYVLHTPTTARSFGATNAQIFSTIRSVAQSEGILLDPIYSAKLYLLLIDLLEKGALPGPTLFIHSGGTFSLAGFQSNL